MKKLTLLLSAMLMAVMSFGAEYTTTISFANRAQRTVYSSEQQVWEQNGLVVTNDKAASTTNVGDYADPVRFYKSSSVTIKCTLGTIKKMVFTCGTYSGKDYPADLVASVGSEAVANGLDVTITPTASSDTYKIAQLSAQVRIAKIAVTYEGDKAPEGGGDGGGTVVPPTDETLVIPEAAKAWNIPAEAIDVLKAREICAGLASDATTGTKYYVMGYVKKIHSKHADGVANYGNAQFYMENVKGGNSDNDFMAYQVYGLNGQKITDANAVAVGDFVVVYGELTNYMGNTYETVGKGAAYIWNSTNPLLTNGNTPTPPTPPTDLVGDGTEDNPYTVDDVLALNNTSKGPHYVKGFIIGQVNGASIKEGLDTEAPFVGSTNSDGSIATQGTNLMIASVAGETTKIVAVQLPKNELRDAFNLVENPDMLGKEILIHGSLEKYFGVAGIKSPTSIELIGGDNGNIVNVKGLPYADAYYVEEDGSAYWDIQLYNVEDDAYLMPIVLLGVEAKSKTSLNGAYDLFDAFYGTSMDENTYDLYSISMDTEATGKLTIKNVDNENNYSFVGSFVGEDGKTYKINTVANVYAEDDATAEEIELKEEDNTNPPTPPTPPTDGAIVFDADVDKGNAGTDSNNATAYQITKNGVTLDVTSGILGTYNNESHYRIYKNQTLTITSTVGNIAKVEFTCTANNDEKYGPGCFTVDGGDYNYSGAVGTWTGNAATIKFTASTNQVRASQIVVTLVGAGSDVENVVVGATPVKMIENGQLIIIRGDKVFNVLGAQVK